MRVKSYADQQQKANYVCVGLFCAWDVLNRGRFCICVQEVDSAVEFPVACTALCPSHLYLSCVSDRIWRDQKGDVTLFMRGAAGAFSQRQQQGQWSRARSLGWSLVPSGEWGKWDWCQSPFPEPGCRDLMLSPISSYWHKPEPHLSGTFRWVGPVTPGGMLSMRPSASSPSKPPQQRAITLPGCFPSKLPGFGAEN